MFDGNIWVLIPLAAILIGGFSEYLKFKAKQQKLGDSTKETEMELSRLNKQLETKNHDLVRRIENLEAIVTSQAWDDIHGMPETAAKEARAPLGDVLDDDTGHGDLDLEDEERAERLARRLRNG